MTDVSAIGSRLMEGDNRDGVQERVRAMTLKEKSRFSPPVLACLSDPALCRELDELLNGDGEEYYREIYRTLTEVPPL